jgi:hypothetical protein
MQPCGGEGNRTPVLYSFKKHQATIIKFKVEIRPSCN